MEKLKQETRSETMIEAVDLRMVFGDGTKALDGVSFEVLRGEIFGLLGPNGAGKTTTVNLFLDLIQPTGGKALIKGIEVAREPRRAKSCVELIPENVALYPTLTAMENVEFLGAVGLGRGPERDRIRQALLRVGLPEEVHDRRVATFSKGMRQKTGLAVALLRQAPVVLLDEPTSGLDPAAAADLVELLDQLRSDGAAILLCTHDIFRAQQLCDRIGIMRQGRMQSILDRKVLDESDLEQVYLETMVQV